MIIWQRHYSGWQINILCFKSYQTQIITVTMKSWNEWCPAVNYFETELDITEILQTETSLNTQVTRPTSYLPTYNQSINFQNSRNPSDYFNFSTPVDQFDQSISDYTTPSAIGYPGVHPNHHNNYSGVTKTANYLSSTHQTIQYIGAVALSQSIGKKVIHFLLFNKFVFKADYTKKIYKKIILVNWRRKLRS